MREKEETRRNKRNEVRDQNRPIFDNFSSSDTEAAVEDDGDNQWSEGDEARPVKPRNFNDSLDHIRQQEDMQVKRKQARRRSFSKNRRSSASFHRQRSPRTPRKGSIQNFVSSNLSAVNRMSDYFVQKRSLSADAEDKAPKSVVTFNEVKVFVFGVIVAIMAVIVYAHFTHNKA